MKVVLHFLPKEYKCRNKKKVKIEIILHEPTKEKSTPLSSHSYFSQPPILSSLESNLRLFSLIIYLSAARL